MYSSKCGCVAIVCLAQITFLLAEKGENLVADECKDAPEVKLFVVNNEETNFVEVYYDEEEVTARTQFSVRSAVTIKNFWKRYSKRLVNDFLPYNVTQKKGSLVVGNRTTFHYKRPDKAEDQPYQVTFYGGFYFGNVEGKNQYQLLGLNQVWLGCPMPMCLYGTVDAAFRDTNGVYITRGKYYWNLRVKKPPLVQNALLLKDYAKIETAIIDAAFVTGNYFFYFKDKVVYCYDKSAQKSCANFGKGGTKEDLPTFFSVRPDLQFTPEYCEAAFSFSNDENAKVALYGESEYRKLAIFTVNPQKKNGDWYTNNKVVDFPLLFHKKIDAMVEVDGKVWIFMAWINYKIPVEAMEDTNQMDSKKSSSYYNFADPFNCPAKNYKGWVFDFEKYSEEMNQIVESDNHQFNDIKRRIDLLPDEQRVGTSKPSDTQSALPFILAAILILVIIIVIIIIVTEKRRRTRKKKQQSDKPEEVDLRAPAMGSLLETRSVVGSVIQEEYKPGKKLPASAYLSKASATGSKIDTGSTIGVSKKIGPSSTSGTSSTVGESGKLAKSGVSIKSKAPASKLASKIDSTAKGPKVGKK